MHELDLILTLTAGLATALVFGYVTQRLGLSPIVGYLIAGLAVGEYTPGIRIDEHLAKQMADIGVILLMFGVGLQFHFNELLEVRGVAVPGAVGQIVVATALGALVAWLAGWGLTGGVVFGLAVSVASTVVMLRVLADNNDLHTPAGHIAVGWLVVEDIFTVFVLVLLPTLFENAAEKNIVRDVGLSLVKIAALIVFTVVVGGRTIPWLLEHMASLKSRELFTLTVLVVALGIAVGSATLFGASPELGAFLAGMVVGQSQFSFRAASEALPLRDAFAVLFFVSIGMLFDPMSLTQAPVITALTVAVVLVGKPLAALVLVAVLGRPPRVAVSVAIALAQIGEFSFILAGLAHRLDLIPTAAINVLVVAAVVLISLNPLLYRLLGPLESWLDRHPAFWRMLGGRVSPVDHGSAPRNQERYRAIVIGYGPVGQTVVRLLRENDIDPTIIELNLSTIQSLREAGLDAVYGDATRRETLEGAGAGTAVALILTASAVAGNEEVIRLARELNPKIRVTARSNYLREIPGLRKVGADEVFAGEGEVALSLTESLLRQLGATDEQIDRESARIRSDLFGAAPPPLTRFDGDSKPH